MKPIDITVVMVPMPCQSHLNQLLQLSALIASQDLPVHFIGSETHNRQAKLRSHGLNPNVLSQIQFHDLPTAPILDLSPDPYATNKVPVHLWPATDAYFKLRQPITSLVETISLGKKRVVIIYDRLVSEAVREAVLIPNAESYAFNCLSAFNLFFILWEMKGKPFQVHGELKSVPSMREFIPEDALQFMACNNVEERSGDIHNTSILIDRTYVDLMSRGEISGNKKQWAIMPSVKKGEFSLLARKKSHKCLDWIDKQASRSVIYVSFGTTTSLNEEEAREIAMGLEKSGKKFIWVLRDADKADIFAGEERRIKLPEGFEERVQENGMVIREWAPQLEILSHKSIGGFMTHCGWNSCFESLVMGVPIAAWPIHSDQPLNALFLTEVLKVGLVVRDWEKRAEIVEASVVKDAVERLIGSDEGNEMRKRAEELSEAIRESVEEGGESWRELNEFIAHITR